LDGQSSQEQCDFIDLYRHPEKRARMMQCAAEDYEAYRWEVMAKLYQQLLTALL
jgi:hypothetical protein